METISSSLTFFYKFVFTALWSGGFGLGTLALFLSSTPEARDARWQFAGVWIVGSAFSWWLGARLKRVELDGTTLVISNYRDDVWVHARDIVEVRQNRFAGLRPITLVFREETRFGKAVTFMPQVSSTYSPRTTSSGGSGAWRAPTAKGRPDHAGRT